MKILVPIGCRSDEGLSKPIIKRLKEDPFFQVETLRLEPFNFHYSFEKTKYAIDWLRPIDLIFITGDRVEMCACACAGFHEKIKIAHYFAGITNDPITTFDDINRHCMTLWSDIQFCESWETQKVVCQLCKLIKKKENSHIVGISHFDDVEIDESLCPKEPYNLVLINSTPLSQEIDHKTEELNFLKREKNIIIGSNPDGKSIDDKEHLLNPTYFNLERDQFLGLLKNCKKFVTNSSSAYYEAPYFLSPDQIVKIGNRNKNRNTAKELKVGASNKIVKILKEWWLKENDK